MAILSGHGNIIPGLDKALEGHVAGDSFGVDVAAADAYGERRDGLTQRVPKKHFKEQKLAPGMQVVLNTNFGPRAVTIQKVGMSVVRSEEHTSELQSLMRTSYAVFCLKNNNIKKKSNRHHSQ